MASAAQLKLEVATPLGLALQTDVDSLEAPSVHGEFGVFPGHRPLLAALKCGILKYHVGGKDFVAAIGPGFAEAGADKALLLSDAFVEPKDIDLAVVRDELAEAEKKLSAFPEFYEGPDYRELQRAIDWAHARLEAKAYSER